MEIYTVPVNYPLWWAAAAACDLLHTGDGLKFTFDLSLPGKRASRKSPNTRKVRENTSTSIYELLFMNVFLSSITSSLNNTFLIYLSVQYHTIFDFWIKTVCSDRGDPRLPGEPGLRVVRPGGRGQPRSLETVRTGRPSICLSSALLLMLLTLWFSLFRANDALWLLSLPSPVCLWHRHVMRELIETERIYAEELLSVLLVRKHTFFSFKHVTQL